MKNPFIIILYLNITGCLDIELTFEPTRISMLYFLVNWFQPQPQPYRSLICCLARIAHTPRSCRPSHFLLSNFQISPDSFKRLRCANIIVSWARLMFTLIAQSPWHLEKKQINVEKKQAELGNQKERKKESNVANASMFLQYTPSTPSACLSCDYVPISCLWFCVPHDK